MKLYRLLLIPALSFSVMFSYNAEAKTESSKSKVSQTAKKKTTKSKKNVKSGAKKPVKAAAKKAPSKSSAIVQQNSYSNLFYPNKYAALVVDAKSGTILQEANGSNIRYPASLTKLMTLYLTFESLKLNKFTLDERISVSRHAASMPRMSLALKPFENVPVRTLINSLVVLSANDSAVVLGEKIAGSESDFARLMTTRAHQLGMKDTTFTNASGLFNPKQVTTARDLAKLMMALRRDYPQYYNMLSITSFSYNRQDFGTHNHLMTDYAGAKAGKTGYVSQSGFNLVLNAEKNGSDVIGVVLGGKTAKARDGYMAKLLDNNFAKLFRSKNKYALNSVEVKGLKRVEGVEQ